jgi:hypothetical protein
MCVKQCRASVHCMRAATFGERTALTLLESNSLRQHLENHKGRRELSTADELLWTLSVGLCPTVLIHLNSYSVSLCAPQLPENELLLTLSTHQSEAVHVCLAQIALAFTTCAPQIRGKRTVITLVDVTVQGKRKRRKRITMPFFYDVCRSPPVLFCDSLFGIAATCNASFPHPYFSQPC